MKFELLTPMPQALDIDRTIEWYARLSNFRCVGRQGSNRCALEDRSSASDARSPRRRDAPQIDERESLEMANAPRSFPI